MLSSPSPSSSPGHQPPSSLRHCWPPHSHQVRMLPALVAASPASPPERHPARLSKRSVSFDAAQKIILAGCSSSLNNLKTRFSVSINWRHAKNISVSFQSSHSASRRMHNPDAWEQKSRLADDSPFGARRGSPGFWRAAAAAPMQRLGPPCPCCPEPRPRPPEP